MEYKLKIADETVDVSANVREDSNLSMSFGDRDFNVAYNIISDHQIHLAIDGVGVNAYVADTENGKIIWIGGKSCIVTDIEALEQKGAGRRGSSNLPDKVTPNIPSVIISIMVSEGDKVTKGQGLVVLSAMKMETTLYAPFSGTVTKISCAEGDKVAPGNILVEIDPDDVPDDSE